jgi:hypothetical protein
MPSLDVAGLRVHGLAMMRVLIFALVATLSQATYAGEPTTVVSQYETPRLLKGTIYASDRKTKLFLFIRTSKVVGGELEVTRDYTYPDGKPAAREMVTYQGDQFRRIEFKDFQTGASGAAGLSLRPWASRRVLHFEYTERPGTNAKQAEEPSRPDTLVTDMIPPFLLAHWERLMRGEEVKCRVIVIQRRETVGFTFRKVSSRAEAGKVVVKMSASSAIIAALVEPVFFVIEQDAPHHILEYSGRTTPKIKKGNSWKDLEAVTVFDWVNYTP